MTKLILLKKLYHIVKSHPFKTILVQFLINAALVILLIFESNPYLKLLQLITLTISILSLLLGIFEIPTENNEDSGLE